MKLSIIIPCYNEEQTIAKVIERVVAAKVGMVEKEIIVVDDGSTDASSKMLRDLKDTYPLKLLRHEENLGKGQAIITALPYTTGDYIIIQDADLESNPNDYRTFLALVLKKHALVVYGSRRLTKNTAKALLPLYYWGGRFLTLFTNFLYRTNISDVNAGYKLFYAKLIKSIPLREQGFAFCTEITAKVAKRKIQIYEVPMRYRPRRAKEGKKLFWIHGFILAFSLIKYKFTD